MAKVNVSLNIYADKDRYQNISEILKIKGIDYSLGWIYKEKNISGGYNKAIGRMLDILDGHYEEMEAIGVTRDVICINILYKYDQQCNMEFVPTELKRLGDNGIALCISCYK